MQKNVGVRVDVNQELIVVIVKMKKDGGPFGSGRGMWGGCERRIEVIVIQQNKKVGRRGLDGGEGGQGGFERRI